MMSSKPTLGRPATRAFARAASAMAIAAQRESGAATALDLTAIAAERAATLGVPVTVLDREGDPYQHIIRAALEYKADLVVLGASTSLANRLAGSLGVRLVKARFCPVLVVP